MLMINTMMEIMIGILKPFGTFFFFNHRIKGKNINEINIEKASGIKMKESVFVITSYSIHYTKLYESKIIKK